MNKQGVEGANRDINVAIVLDKLFASNPPQNNEQPVTLWGPEVQERAETGIPNLMLTFKPATQDKATATEMQVASRVDQTVESEAPEEIAPADFGQSGHQCKNGAQAKIRMN